MLGCYPQACWLHAQLNWRGSRGPQPVCKAVNLEASLLAAANVQASVPGDPAAAVWGAAVPILPGRPHALFK